MLALILSVTLTKGWKPQIPLCNPTTVYYDRLCKWPVAGIITWNKEGTTYVVEDKYLYCKKNVCSMDVTDLIPNPDPNEPPTKIREKK